MGLLKTWAKVTAKKETDPTAKAISALMPWTPVSTKTRYTSASKPQATSPTQDIALQDYDIDSAVNSYMSAYGDLGSSGSGGYGGSNIDLSGILSAYDQAAAANRATAKQTYETQRSDLLTSLKRFQEENARNVENQKRNYLLGQSALESARAEADRQSRIGTSARGLAGSGLQQLAQLQNLISQGQDISNLATENQQAMDSLRLALAQREEDTNTDIANALAVYNNALQSIDADLATNKANIQYQAQENEANRRAQAAAQAASNRLALAQLQADARDTARAASSLTASAVESFKNVMSKAKKSERNEAFNNVKAELLKELSEYGIGANDSIAKTGLSNLKAVFDAYNK